MDADNIIHLDLRSDLENDNFSLGSSTYFNACGFWERLPLHLAEQVGDTSLMGQEGFLIQAIDKNNMHTVTHAYFYDSEYEYWNDHKITKGIEIENTEVEDKHIYDKVLDCDMYFERSSKFPNYYGELTEGEKVSGIRIFNDHFRVDDSDFKITPKVLEIIQELQDYVGKENVGKFATWHGNRA